MAGAAAEGEAEQQLAGRVQRYPRDLLRQFSGGVVVPEETRPAASAGTEEEDSGEIELSLGLSLGGCFGVDPAQGRGLHRSPSVAAIPLLQQREHEYSETVPPLKRTYSLPAEAEEERRKRKELQCLRWTEPKRKKPEKVNGSWTWARDPAASPEEEGDRGGRRPVVDLDLRRWWAPNGTAAAGQAREGVRRFAAVSQRSVGSQGSSSSGVCDFASRPPKQQELLGNGSDDWRSSSRIQSLPDLTEHTAPTVRKPLSCTAAREEEEEEEEEVDAPQKKTAAAAVAAVGIGSRGGSGTTGAMEEDMPWVSTRGVGPDGRRVEGLLYRYGKGEEVRIVCVCHGRFLSPAEFVRHAGGGDVAHPLRHIIVSPSPPSFL